MKTLSRIFLTLCLSLVFVAPRTAQAEIPAKAKAFLTITGYGAASGALLGAASMAFGTSTRAIAQGASLGLYAGIIFGTYVLVSHHQRSRGYYDDDASPYRNSSELYNDSEYDSSYGGSDNSSRSGGGFFDRHQSIQTKFNYKEKGGNLPPIYMNLFQYNF